MKFKILYQREYFERELYLLEINGKYTKVYKSSGLNNGEKGRIIPFTTLMDHEPRFSEIRDGIVIGYIWKEYFYNGYYKVHSKKFSEITNTFLKKIEKKLENINLEKNNDDIKNIMTIAKKINIEMTELTNGKKIFDWYENNLIEINKDFYENKK